MIVNLKTLLKYAEERESAVGSFNYSSLESVLAIIKAAEELDYPVILSYAQVHSKYIDIHVIFPLVLKLANESKIPICLHLDHGTDVDYIKSAIDMGFTSVMFDGSSLPYEDNVRLTKKVVEYARKHNVSVEAELGRLMSSGGDEADEDSNVVNLNPEEYYTNSEQAKEFIEATNIDCLAIAFGTVHGEYTQEPKLSYDVVSNIRKKTNDFPLVMHGGSGVSESDYMKVIKLGIRKINYYTYMQRAGYKAIENLINSKRTKYYHDIVLAGIDAMYKDTLKAMKVFSRNN